MTHGPVILGYITPPIIAALKQDKETSSSIAKCYDLDHESGKLTLCGHGEEERSSNIAAITSTWRSQGRFAVLKGWRNELYPVYGADQELLFSIERAASALFGVITYGVHMTVFTRTSKVLKIWVPRRARTKQTYGGMLDNTVAGGIATGELPLESLVREAEEEASLPEALVRRDMRAVGAVTYWHERDERAGGETGLLQPECEYVYDLEVGPDVSPKPNDKEVETFHLWTVEEVQQAMARGEFKPNCAVVLLDFFVRHGILTAPGEKDYLKIVARTHRMFPFPMAF